MKKFLTFVASALLLASCGNDQPDDQTPVIDPDTYSKEILYVVNAGNWGYSNASLTQFNPENKLAYNNVFFEANGFKLGDTAQSAIMHGAQCWVVVNNSNVIFGCDADNMIETGRIDKGLISPRYMHFVDNEKAYVSQMYTDSIAVVDTKQYKVVKRIGVPKIQGSLSDGSCEEFVQIGQYAYSNMWSYGNSIIKIDTKTDRVVGTVKVGIQPYSIQKDAKGDIWCLCDGGGWDANPAGYEAPSLVCIDPETMMVKKTFTMKLGDTVSKLAMDAGGDTLYWIINRYDEAGKNTGGIFKMPIDAASIPDSPLVASEGKYFYSLTISPIEGSIYAAEPLDYTQSGDIYYFSASGELKGQFKAGIIPTAYAWRLK